MGEGEGGEESFSPSALSLFRFHLSPFPPEMPDTQASCLIVGIHASGISIPLSLLMLLG